MTEKELHEKYEFRTVRPEETAETANVEVVCFPPNEAAAYKDMEERILTAPDLFIVAIDRATGKMAGFLNGLATNEEAFRDEFFTDASLHNPQGKNVMLLGLDVMPDYRMQGLARELVRYYAKREQERGRKKLLLTCLDNKVEMYKKFGFTDLGMSASVWGGEAWHEMEINL